MSQTASPLRTPTQHSLIPPLLNGNHLTLDECERRYDVLKDGEYLRLAPQPDGAYHSETFPGLWLETPALLRGNPAAALQTMHNGLAAPKHATFMESLRSKKTECPTP